MYILNLVCKAPSSGTLQIKISNRQIIKMYLGVRESMVLKRIPINRLRSSILERNNNYVINHDKPVLGGAGFSSFSLFYKMLS